MRRSVLLSAAVLLVATAVAADWNTGVAAFRKGDYEVALKEFNAVLAASPEYAGAHYMIGRSLAQLGRPAEALKAYREANRLDPANAQFAISLATALLDGNKAPEAGKALAGVHLDPLRPNQKAAFLAVKAQAELALGNTAAALDLARQAAAADGASAQAFTVLGLAQAAGAQDAEAFAAFRKAWELSGDPALGVQAAKAGIFAARRADAAGKRHAYDEAAAVAAKVAEKKPGPDISLLAGEAVMGAQRYDEALGWFNRTGQTTPIILYYKGQCFQGKRELAQAESLFRRAIAAGPDADLRQDILTSLGFVLDLQKRYGDAAAAYAEAGNAAKAAEMKDKEAKSAQNLKADEEAKRLQELQRLQDEYKSLSQQGAPPTPTPKK
jgi:tetratricopeptide (TPR) repeat protein